MQCVIHFPHSSVQNLVCLINPLTKCARNYKATSKNIMCIVARKHRDTSSSTEKGFQVSVSLALQSEGEARVPGLGLITCQIRVVLTKKLSGRPGTNTKRSQIVFAVTSIALSLGRPWTQLFICQMLSRHNGVFSL